LIAWFLEDSPLCDLVRYSYFGVKKLLLTFFYHKIYYFGDVYFFQANFIELLFGLRYYSQRLVMY
ncbi:MAG: hypothetical protein KME28_12730, partial [Pelatocladus maniniholoensis HA4357-MV3]|nr:hypothetical protein [Pelatocladus maniniholoensis HA4357-MV3]